MTNYYGNTTDYVGAPLNQQELAMAQQLLNNSVSGDVDIVGAEVVGSEVEFSVSGDHDEVGRLRRRRVPMQDFQRMMQSGRFALPPALAGLQGAFAGLRRPTGTERPMPTDGRRGFLPISSAAPIAAGASQSIEAKVSRAFRPDALIIDSAIADDFLLTDIKLGLLPVTVGSGPIPASMFTRESRFSQLALYTLQVNEPAVIAVTNRSTDPRSFVACLTGVYLG